MKRFFIVIFSVAFILSCKNDVEDINAFDDSKDLSVETTKEVELIYSDSAIVKVIVNAPIMLTYKDKINPRQEFIQGLNVDFFNGGLNSASQLSAKNAVRYDRKKEIIMTDSVVWKSAKNEILESEELIWNENTKKVYSKRFVKITTPEDIIYGYGFEADEDFSKWRITAPQGTMSVNNTNEQ